MWELSSGGHDFTTCVSHVSTLYTVLMLYVNYISVKLGKRREEKFEFRKLGLPGWLSGKEFACQCKIHRFDPCSGKTPHASEQLSPHATTIEPVL